MDAAVEQLNAALSSGDGAEADAIEAAYRQALKAYPTSEVLWVSFAQWKYLCGDFAGLEGIFGEVLKSICSVRLWRLYLHYIRAAKTAGRTEAEEAAQGRAVLLKAYESAVLHVGLDVDSMPIWWDYLDFVRSQPAATFFEQQQVMDQTRRLFHRALLMPIDGIETLWHAYDAYENGLNKITAKKMLADRSPSYMLARSFCKQLKDLLLAVDRESLPLPPAAEHNPAAKVAAWMNWIGWERANPLKIAEAPVLHARIHYAYRCAVGCMRHYPELAFDYARYLVDQASASPVKEAEAVLRQALDLSPDNLLAAFALADYLEAASNAPEAKAVYTDLLTALEAAVDRLAPPAAGEAHPPATLSVEAKQACADLTLAFIQFMQFSRRSEGINPARAVFTRARKNPSCTHQLYVAAARMEYHCKKDPAVAAKIFELGMGKFGDQTEYVLDYLHHLIQLNDDANTRALFERSLQTVAQPDAMEIWKLYLDYEFHYGDLRSIDLLQKRFKKAFPEEPISKDISLFTRHYTYADLVPANDRVWALLQPGMAASPLPLYRSSRPKLSVQFDSIAELALRLPPPHLYKGPPIDAGGLVGLLQVARTPGAPAPPRKGSSKLGSDLPTSISKTRREERTIKMREKDRDRERDRGRHRERGGRRGRSKDQKAKPSVSSSRRRSASPNPPPQPHGREDLFEQRYRQREMDRNK